MTDDIGTIRRYFDAAPEPSEAARQRVAARVTPLWAPPAQPSESTGRGPRSARRPWHRPWRVVTAVGLAVAAGSAGAGIAAATGAFNSQAHSAFARAANTHSAELGHAGTQPTATPPTTTADPSPRAGSERIQITTPGPDGSILQLVTTPERGRAGTCYVVTTTNPGAATAPGKPPYTPGAQCIASNALHHDGDVSGALWVSRTGARYMITVGRAQGAATIEIVARHVANIDAKVTNGWYVVAVPYGLDQTNHTEIARSSSGRIIANIDR
jgi:hypothetical protein